MKASDYEAIIRFYEFCRELRPSGSDTVLLADPPVVRAFLARNPECRSAAEVLTGSSIFWELDRKRWEKVQAEQDRPI